MSTLVVEVCEVSAVERHPGADRMAIATIKGWKTCIRKDPETGEAEFKVGDKCVYFPPDSILPPELANGPDDSIPGRLNVMKYLAPLAKVDGQPQLGGRVRAARLRGMQSFGLIMHIDPEKGDDPNWAVGTDVREHFGVTKYDPPLESSEGDAEKDHPRFHTYTNIEHLANYPDVLQPEEQVVITEKIHGKNCRVGIVLDTDETGEAVWKYMAGSHSVPRKEWSENFRRFEVESLLEKQLLTKKQIKEGFVFTYDSGVPWKIVAVRDYQPKNLWERVRNYFVPYAPTHIKTKQMIEQDGVYTPYLKRSEFWDILDENMRAMFLHVLNDLEWHEPKSSVILFGELFGSGVQDLAYGLENGERQFRAFDIAINRQYVDFETKQRLFAQFNIAHVPNLYRGPYSKEIVEAHTDGSTTVSDKVNGKFKGREGVVVTPVVERLHPVRGRVIFKSVSADYLSRSGGTEFH